ATAALGAVLPLAAAQNFGLSREDAVVAPMVVAGIGIILSLVGIFLVRCGKDSSMKALLHALERGTRVSSVLIVVAMAALAGIGVLPWSIVACVATGLICGTIIGVVTGYYTSDAYKPTQGIANQSRTGAATVIIDGIAVGMYSAGIPAVTVVLAILCSYGFTGGFTDPAQGVYGIAFAAVGMLATLGITLATDAYGPIADNAGGNAEMSHLDPIVRERTDALDMLGNTTAAIGKGFAIGSAALTALALLVAYKCGVDVWIDKIYPGEEAVRIKELAHDLSILNPMLLSGLFIGGMTTFVFCAMTMKAVGRAAGAMVEEVRRQFREIPGIMDETATPDYQRCVAISTEAAQKEMVFPSILAVSVPVVVGLILGVPGVLGLLCGALICGFSLACMLNNAGGAWDNAKKYIEKGELGGKGSEEHKATVVGDTVGDPFKDTSGPSLNILIKLMSMVSLIFTPLIVKFSPVIQSFLFGL
ncbi:MAG: sodium-translocating pyrophosphatase, partial [Lentisphaeria bacterium]|nr:sodium-translocating pyrophosphatase [Lentisphaeria bacterium]